MEFAQIFDNLLKEQKVSAYRMYKDTGIPEATIGRWRKGTSSPSIDNLQKIANYFNISIDYLLGQKKGASDDIDGQEFSPEAKLIAKLFDSLDEKSQAKAEGFLAALADQNKP